MRLQDYRIRLGMVVQEAQRTAFEWGMHDCCQFAAQCVQAVTGRDALELFPAYADEAGALAIIEQCGGLEALIDKALGADKRKHPAFATRGDIALMDMGKGPQPAVCLGVLCVAPGAVRLEQRSIDKAIAVWSVD